MKYKNWQTELKELKELYSYDYNGLYGPSIDEVMQWMIKIVNRRTQVITRGKNSTDLVRK